MAFVGESKAQKFGEAGVAATLRICAYGRAAALPQTLHMSIDLVRPSDATSARALLGDWMQCLQCPADGICPARKVQGRFLGEDFFPVLCVAHCFVAPTGGSVVVCRSRVQSEPKRKPTFHLRVG